MIDQEQVLEILHAIGEKITEEKLYLTELDNVIGDGDHGINLARGFAEVEKKRPMMEGKDIGTMLKTAGMALVSTVGGASGPLYGTAFMQAGKALGKQCRKAKRDGNRQQKKNRRRKIEAHPALHTVLCWAKALNGQMQRQQAQRKCA